MSCKNVCSYCQGKGKSGVGTSCEMTCLTCGGRGYIETPDIIINMDRKVDIDSTDFAINQMKRIGELQVRIAELEKENKRLRDKIVWDMESAGIEYGELEMETETIKRQLDATREQVKEATRLLKCFKQTQGICTEELEAWLAGIKASTNQNTGQGEK